MNTHLNHVQGATRDFYLLYEGKPVSVHQNVSEVLKYRENLPCSNTTDCFHVEMVDTVTTRKLLSMNVIEAMLAFKCDSPEDLLDALLANPRNEHNDLIMELNYGKSI